MLMPEDSVYHHKITVIVAGISSCQAVECVSGDAWWRGSNDEYRPGRI